MSFGYVSAYLIDGGDELILVDTGIKGKGRAILSAIASAGLDPDRLRHILITHLHTDHVGSLAELQRLTGATVYSHQDEADAIEEGVTLRIAVAAPTIISRLIVKNIINLGVGGRREGTPVDRRLKDGEVLDLAGGIQVVETPGHTAGHCCYLLKMNRGVLLAGDAARGGKAPGYPMLFENAEDGYASIRKLAGLKFDAAFFAHGSPMPAGASAAFQGAWD